MPKSLHLQLNNGSSTFSRSACGLFSCITWYITHLLFSASLPDISAFSGRRHGFENYQITFGWLWHICFVPFELTNGGKHSDGCEVYLRLLDKLNFLRCCTHRQLRTLQVSLSFNFFRIFDVNYLTTGPIQLPESWLVFLIERLEHHPCRSLSSCKRSFFIKYWSYFI